MSEMLLWTMFEGWSRTKYQVFPVGGAKQHHAACQIFFSSPFVLPMIVDVGNPVLMEFIRVKVLDEDASGVPLSNESTEGVVVEPDLEEAVLEDVFQLAQGVVLEHRWSLLHQKAVGVPTDRRTAEG